MCLEPLEGRYGRGYGTHRQGEFYVKGETLTQKTTCVSCTHACTQARTDLNGLDPGRVWKILEGSPVPAAGRPVSLGVASSLSPVLKLPCRDACVHRKEGMRVCAAHL